MTIQNKSVTILGATAKVVSITIFPQSDGSYVVTVNGTATDGASFTEQIATTATFPSGTNILDNMSAAALSKMRIANGLEV